MFLKELKQVKENELSSNTEPNEMIEELFKEKTQLEQEVTYNLSNSYVKQKKNYNTFYLHVKKTKKS